MPNAVSNRVAQGIGWLILDAIYTAILSVVPLNCPALNVVKHYVV
jgi:hypothetical protein